MNKEFIPSIIKGVLYASHGWLVGASIQDILEHRVPTDFDIIVEDRQRYQEVIKFLEGTGADYSLNSYGGLKINMHDGTIFDIWCEELGHFIVHANKFTYAYNYYRDILIKNKI